MVRKELWGKIGSESERIETALGEFIQVMRPPSTNLFTDLVTAGLGDGERQVILLAMSMREGVTVLLDDHAGRKAAKQLDLPVIGIAGILIMAAQQQGLIPKTIYRGEFLGERSQRGVSQREKHPAWAYFHPAHLVGAASAGFVADHRIRGPDPDARRCGLIC